NIFSLYSYVVRPRLRSLPTRRSSDLNILSAAHLNALSDFLGMMLLPSVPHLELDTVAGVVRAILADSNRVGEYAFSIETRFTLRSEEHTSELQSRENLVCSLLLEKNR